VIDQQGDDRARKRRIAFLFEGMGAAAAGDEAPEPRRIEHAFVEIEGPLTRLSRHQHAHQPLRQARDDGARRTQLQLETSVQLDELGAGGECERVDDAIVRRRVGVIGIGTAACVHLRARAGGITRRIAALPVLAQRRLRAARITALRQLAQPHLAPRERHAAQRTVARRRRRQDLCRRDRPRRRGAGEGDGVVARRAQP
jgi:hypothetical protein